MRKWALGLLAAGALAAAAPVTAAGFQIVVGFDEFPVGTGDFSFDAFGDPGFGNGVFGGVVTAATAAAPAVSGTQVYRGTAIGFRLANPVDYSWPAVGAFVTGSAAITLTLSAYDYDLGSEVVVAFASLGSGSRNAYLSSGDALSSGFFTSALFESTAAFTLDDLTLGLVDVGPGIPEPATWALLLSGFALTGGALRRSRSMRAAA